MADLEAEHTATAGYHLEGAVAIRVAGSESR